MQYLIKLGSEITIKSDGVRKLCIKKLKRNIKVYMDSENIEHRITGNWDKILLEVSDIEDQEHIQQILTYISGIEYFCPIQSFELDELKNAGVEQASELLFLTMLPYLEGVIQPGASFVLRVKRSGKHNFSSPDIERGVGGRIYHHFPKSSVNLQSPDILVKIEIHNTTLHIITDKIQGISGYPVGFQDTVVSLVSGGFDSAVATYMTANRGCKIDYVFFNLGGLAHTLGVKYMIHTLWKQFSLPYARAKCISIPFDSIITTLLTEIPSSYRAIILKRCMIRVTDMIIHSGNYCGAVKGDSIGQVSSQTLKNMAVVDSVSQSLILRPLVGMNKGDIIQTAKKIGVFDIAASMPEYCGIVSDKPLIRSELSDVLSIEGNIFDPLLEQAFTNRVTERVSEMLPDTQENIIEEVTEPSHDIQIIDIRAPERVSSSPLSHKGIKSEIIEIPFYEINHRFGTLDQTQKYALYCDSGVLSQLHGLYLREKGFENLIVLRV